MPFWSDKQQKSLERLDNYLRRQVSDAEKEFDRAQPSRFSFRRQKSNPLEIRLIAIGVVNHTLKALVTVGPSPELLILSVAANVAIDVFGRYYRNVEAATAQDSDGTQDRLSFNLVAKDDRKLDYNVGKMRFSMQKVIVATAEYIEMREFASLDEVMNEEQEASKQRKIQSLVNSQYRLHVSHRAMMISLQLFSTINQELLKSIETEKIKHPEQAHKFLVTNAIFVYEIADFIVTFLQKFELQGTSELRQLYGDATAQITHSRDQIEDVRRRIDERAHSGRETILNLENEKRSLDDRLAALNAVAEIWSGLLRKVDGAEGGSQIFRDYIADIEIIKKNAELNLTILNLMAVTKMVRQNIEKMQQLMVEVSKLRLPAITADDVRRFFALSSAGPAVPLVEAQNAQRM